MQMKTVLIAAVTLTIGAHALAQDALSGAVGLRSWYQTWKGNGPGLALNGRTPVLTQFDNDPELAIIPFASLRAGKFGASASTMLRKTYHGTDGAFSTDQWRREFDLNALYYVLPTASVSVGYKHFKWGDTAGTGDIRIHGPTFALSGSAPLSDALGLYATVAYGPLKAKDSGGRRADTRYVLSEAGLSYSMPGVGGTKAVTFTAGYRYQQLKLKQLGLSRDFWDQTSGFTLGVLASF